MEQEEGFGGVGGRVAEDGDIAVGVEAVDKAGAGWSLDAQAQGACGDASVGMDFESGAQAEDVGPPRAFGGGAEDGAVFFLRALPGGEWSHGQFAVTLVGVAVEAEIGEQGVGAAEVGDGFRGEERREAVLPVLVAALDFAFGLRGGGVAEADVVEAQGGAELGEGVRDAGEKEAVAVHVEGEREAVGEEGAREEVEVGEEVFGGIDAGADAAAAAVVEHVEQGQVRALGPPAVRGGVELPERADFRALPAADAGLGLARRLGGGEALGDGETADRGGIELEVEAAFELAGGKAVARWRSRAEELAQERFDSLRPRRAMVATGGARSPGPAAVRGAGAEVIGVDLVKPGAANTEFGGSGACRQLPVAEGAQDFADVRRSEAMEELLIVFFIAAKMPEPSVGREPASARRRCASGPPLRSGPLAQRRRAECPPLIASTVHLCPQGVRV